MDLSKPLATVTPTLDAVVLQVLAATTAWCSAAEVHRRVLREFGRGSDEGVRKVLDRLAHQGIVTAESCGRSSLYRLNRDHIAFPAIELLTQARQTLFDRVATTVEGWDVAPRHVSWFGSFARGEARSDSDIDVLVIRPVGLAGPAEMEWHSQLAELESSLNAWTGNPVQIVDPTPETVRHMQRTQDPLFLSWVAEEVPISGERLLEALRGVA